MPWIITNVDDMIFKGEKRPRGYISRMGIAAASALEKTGKVSIISEIKARSLAPQLFVVEEELAKIDLEEAQGSKDNSEQEDSESTKLKAMTSKQLAAWLRDHEEEVSVPRTKPERLALALELVEGP